MSELISGTVAQAIAWIVSVGIVAFVAYGLSWTNWDAETKKRVAYVLVAVLTALVTALASFIPDTWQAMKVIDAIFALLATLAGSFGAWHFAEFKAMTHILQMHETATWIKRSSEKQTPLIVE